MPLQEIKRLRAVDRFLSIQFENEKEVRDLVRLAAEICGAKIASITILDAVTQHFRYSWGIDIAEADRQDAFCSLTITGSKAVIINDTLSEPQLANNPYVTGAPYVRFYAGVPLLTHDGHNVGSLCVLDDHTIDLSEAQLSMLYTLAKQIVQLFELQASIILLKEKLEDVRQSQIRLKSFFESKLLLHLLLDADLHIISFNNIFSKLALTHFNKLPKEGDDIREYLQEHSATDFLTYCVQALEGKELTVNLESRNVDAVVNWMVYFEPAIDPQGNIFGISCNALDVSQKVLQDAQLLKQNEHLREVAFYQSHELRRPVSSILGIVAYLYEKFGDKIPEEIELLKLSTMELDEKIRHIVQIADQQTI